MSDAAPTSTGKVKSALTRRYQQVPGAVREHPGARVRVAIEKAAVDVPAGPGTEPVQLAGAGFGGSVHEQLEVVLDVGGAPGDDGVGDALVAVLDEIRGLRVLRPPAGRRAVLQLEGERRVAAIAEVRADSAGCGDAVPVALVGGTVLQAQPAHVGLVFQDEVQHPGDGVRTVLGGRPVAQDFHAFQGDAGQRHDVHRLRALVDARHELADHGAAVPALAVDEYQRAVRGEPAQVGRADQRRRVADRLAAHVVGRDERGERVEHVTVAGGPEVLSVEDVHGHLQGPGRPLAAPRPDDHHFLQQVPVDVILFVGAVQFLRPDGQGADHCQQPGSGPDLHRALCRPPPCCMGREDCRVRSSPRRRSRARV